jgi:hypothetical protein
VLQAGVSALLATHAPLAASRAGLSHTLLEPTGPGGVGGPAAAPLARPPEHECVLVQGGRRRGLRLAEALEEARDGALVLLRPGTYSGHFALQHQGVTLAGDGAALDCVLQGDSPSARAVVTCFATGCQLINLSVRYTGAVADSAAVMVRAPPP